MSMMVSSRTARLAIVLATLVGVEGTVHAQGDRGAVRDAAHSFADGKDAFRRGDYVAAGRAFEEAYASAPHEDATWNAAYSWQRAGEVVRAANLYGRYLREAPPGAPDRSRAIAALALLAKGLGRLELHATGDLQLQLDGEQVEPGTLYVAPGSHRLRGRDQGGPFEQAITVDAGATMSLALPPSPRPSPVPPSHDAASPAHEVAAPAAVASAPAPRSGWSPAVFWAGVALTTVTVGVAMWSSIDTLGSRADFDRAPTREGLVDGRAKMIRTNVSWGIASGLGALTVVSGLFFIDWGAGRRVAIAPGLGSVILHGRL